MCGIAGIAGLADPASARPLIAQMTAAIAHRGPDADGFFVEASVALGHRRLSIIDLSTSANQPISDPSGRYTIVYNGEVYNYRALKAELKDFAFQSDSDTDVILAAYQAWGAACLERLNGMFAFAIWDRDQRSLFLARDRLGIKPLYYHEQGEQLVFASEVRALLASGLVPKRMDSASLSEYLRYYSVNAPRTLLAGVQQMPAGHYALWQHGELALTRYWNPAEAAAEVGDAPYEVVKDQVRDLLQAAVERRLMSDVPFGAFLSGGIDSSAIVALMATVSEQPINTFSIVFDEKQFDESPWSSMMAKKYGTTHHPIKLSPADFLRELPQALAAMDHPSGDGLNSYVVSQATKRQGFTVALSGLGGDELFAGYPVFKRYQKLTRLRSFYRVPHGWRSLAGQAVATVYRNHKTARLQELIELEHNRFQQLYPIFRKIYNDREIDRLLGGHAPAEAVLQSLFSPADCDAIDRLPSFSQVSIGEVSTYTQNVLLRDTDQMSMAHALEVRVPFFDHTLVEYALGVPDRLKEPTYPKKLLVDAMGDLLPHDLVHRKKMGFVFPWDEWMRGELKSLCEARMHRLAQRDLFKPAEVQRIWQGYLARDKQITWIKVWMLVVLENWMEANGIGG
jgi:asparagine synthase (glutamine-hydrolysing)